jgi:hypothetical protein
MAPVAETHSDRVRTELAFNTHLRPREVGRVVHQAIARVASLERRVDPEEVDQVCRGVLKDHPINAPKKLARPLVQICPNTAMGVRLLPPLRWSVLDTEVELPSGSRVDLVFESDSPVVVADHLGDVLGVEVKLAASADAATLSWTRKQVHQHLDGLVDLYGERVLGVATYTLGHPRRSLLTLADAQRSTTPLCDTELTTFPTGRLDLSRPA